MSLINLSKEGDDAPSKPPSVLIKARQLPDDAPLSHRRPRCGSLARSPLLSLGLAPLPSQQHIPPRRWRASWPLAEHRRHRRLVTLPTKFRSPQPQHSRRHRNPRHRDASPHHHRRRISRDRRRAHTTAALSLTDISAATAHNTNGAKPLAIAAEPQTIAAAVSQRPLPGHSRHNSHHQGPPMTLTPPSPSINRRSSLTPL